MDEHRHATAAIIDIIGEQFPDTPYLHLRLTVIKALDKALGEIRDTIRKEDEKKLAFKYISKPNFKFKSIGIDKEDSEKNK